MRSLALLTNPESGSGETSELPRRLRELGAEVSEFEIGEFNAAASSGAERLVVAGGDGSIAPAARAAALRGIPLAVLPAGTANDFARAHDLPLDLSGACELAVNGERSRSIDIALLDGRPFLNVASIGLSPAAAEKADGLKGLLGPLAYLVGALRAGVTAPAVSCRVYCDEMEGEENAKKEWFTGNVWQLTVACSGAFGGGSSVEADPADGWLDVIVIEAGSRLALPLRAFGLRRGGIERQEGVLKKRCRSIRVEVQAGTSFNVDGELIDGGNAKFGVEPRAVELVCG